MFVSFMVHFHERGFQPVTYMTCSLDAQLASSDAAQIVLDVRRDMDALQAKILSSHKQNRPAMRQEMRDLRLLRIFI